MFTKKKVYSAFVLSCLVDNYPTGQESAKQNHLIAICAYLLGEKQSRDYESPLLRQWLCICLGLSWQNYPEARWEGVRCNAHQYLIGLVSDPVAEVRAAAIFALGTYIGCGQGNEATVEHTNKIHAEIVSALIKEYDMVYVVRKELVVALFSYINQFVNQQQQQANGTHSIDMSRHSSSSSLFPPPSAQSGAGSQTPSEPSTPSNASASNLPKSQSASTLTRSSSNGTSLNQQQQQSQNTLERISESKPIGASKTSQPSNNAQTNSNTTSSTSDYSSASSSASGSNLPKSSTTTVKAIIFQ